MLGALMVLVFAGCQYARSLPIVSPCAVDVRIDIVDQDGHEGWSEGLIVSPEGTTGGVGTEDSYFAIVGPSGEVLAETSLPNDELDEEGKNDFPPLQIPEELCPP